MRLEDMPDVMTIGEVAAVLRIGRGTAYQMATRKLLPTVALGRRIVVPKRALIAMLDTTQCGMVTV